MPDRRDDFAIAHVARLARLHLTPGEETLFSKQLAEILDYAGRILAVPIPEPGAEPRGQDVSAPAARVRPDQVVSSIDRDAVLRNAPDAVPATGLIRVPRVIG